MEIDEVVVRVDYCNPESQDDICPFQFIIWNVKQISLETWKKWCNVLEEYFLLTWANRPISVVTLMTEPDLVTLDWEHQTKDWGNVKVALSEFTSFSREKLQEILSEDSFRRTMIHVLRSSDETEMRANVESFIEWYINFLPHGSLVGKLTVEQFAFAESYDGFFYFTNNAGFQKAVSNLTRIAQEMQVRLKLELLEY